QAAAGKARLVDVGTRVLLGADVEVHLTVAGVLHFGDDGRHPGARLGQRVLEAHPAERGEVVRAAGIRPGDDGAERATLVTDLLAVHEDPLRGAESGGGVVERPVWQVRRAQPAQVQQG